MSRVCPHCDGTGMVPWQPAQLLTVNGRRLQPHLGIFLAALLARRPQPVRYSELFALIWNGNEPSDTKRQITVYAAKLRVLLKSSGHHIQPEWGIGYRLVGPEAIDVTILAAVKMLPVVPTVAA